MINDQRLEKDHRSSFVRRSLEKMQNLKGLRSFFKKLKRRRKVSEKEALLVVSGVRSQKKVENTNIKKTSLKLKTDKIEFEIDTEIIDSSIRLS